MRKAKAGAVDLELAEVEAVVAVLRRVGKTQGVPAAEKPLTLQEAQACLRAAVKKLSAGDQTVEGQCRNQNWLGRALGPVAAPEL